MSVEPENRVTIAGKSYWLSIVDGKPVYGTSQRALQEVPSDSFQITWGDWSKGYGHGYAASSGFYATERGTAVPSFGRLNVLTPPATPAGQLRYWFEEQDSGGRRYLFSYGPKDILKIDITANPPVVRKSYALTTTGFNSNDRIGQAVKATHGGVNYWYFPVNNGDRMVKLTTPVTVSDGVTTTDDTFTAVTSVTKGASHFELLPSGDIWRANSFHSAGAALNRAEISIITAGATSSFETDGNWGQDFPVDDQFRWIVALMSFEELVFVRKQNKWVIATRQADGSILFRDVLPDDASPESTTYGDETSHRGGVWHGSAFLPTGGHLWRHNLYSALPVSPDDDPANTPVRESIGYLPQNGVIPNIAGAGRWLYAPYNHSQPFVMMARAQEAGDETSLPLVWHLAPSHFAAGSINSVYIQRYGTAAPRLWTGVNATGPYYINLNQNFEPSESSGSTTTTFSLKDILFPTNVLLRELRLVIQRSSASFVWSAGCYINGGTLVSLSGTLTASGSLFWTKGTSDTGQQVRIMLQCASSVSTGQPPLLKRLVLEGYFLPDMGDSVTMGIDIDMTAARLSKTRAEVLAELKGYASAVQDFVDPYGTSGYILVQGVSGQAPAKWGGLPGNQIAQLSGQLIEYSA